ncbi:tetratricopeptide repeat-containing sensor histidine kinase [Flavipsychrobacter stenotrophus]|uniref:tetratricopeptide repeat-containing sensor histidine kinase n=1 Tax=Flavipsychrobacter stenotrophus TaxID=2077091 RepID=UPI0013750A44|nr:ATP-binding protein [Flavipsychrobacter stenotrophus]
MGTLLDSARFYKKGNAAKTITFAERAYTLAKEQQQTKEIGEGAFLAGVASYLRGNRDDALRWYMEADKQYEHIHDTLGMVHVYNELCILYLKIKKIPQAYSAINKAIELSRAINDLDQLATGCNNKGLIFMDTKVYDSATHYFTIAYTCYRSIRNSQGMAYSLDYLSSVSAATDEPEKALSYLKESIALLAAFGDKFGEAMSINNVGELLLQQHKPTEAIPYFKEANAKSKAIKFNYLEDNTCVMLADCYQQLGDYKTAFEYTQQHLALHDQMNNENLQKTVEELSAKYETGKKEQQNKLLTEQNERQSLQLSRTRIITAALLAISALIITLLYLFYNRNKLKQEARLQEELLAYEKARATAIVDAEENERQRLARELHDGIGQMLAATRRKIQTLVPTDAQQPDDLKDAIAYVDESIKEVRQLSHDMMPPWLRNKSLVQALEELAQRVKQTTNIEVYTEWVDTNNLQLEKMQVLMLYRSVQEMVGNVLRHSTATTLNIEVVNHDTELTLLVYDNGKGFDKEEVMKNGNGIGLKNIVSRINYVGGHLEIDSHPGQGTTYTIDLPHK